MKATALVAFALALFLLFGCTEKKEKEEVESMGKKVLMIIAPSDFRDEELLEPKKIFEKNKIAVTIASKGTKVATGMLGAKVNVDADIEDINVSDYDAIIFVGGVGSSIYFNDSTAHQIAREAYKKGKIVGAICIAPSTLANAGILKGKKVTSWPSEKTNIEQKGGIHTGKGVERDGNIITANGPQSAKDFGNEILKALG
jgi:protease I